MYGGQAVIEGILIRGQRHAAVCCRNPEGELVTRVEQLPGIMQGDAGRLPVLRGVLLLAETMQLGVRSLIFSSLVADRRDPSATASRATILSAIAFSLSVALALFFVGPLLLTSWVEPRLGHGAMVMFEGLVRLTALLVYVWAIGFVPGVRRLFEHHGAEHMTVNAYEAGSPLTVESIRRFSVIHKRCGTNFLLTVMIVSIAVFALLGSQPLWSELLSRIILVPVIAGLAYEALRLMAVHGDNPIVAIISRPNLDLQTLTTRPPTDEQIELAITAMRTVLVLDGLLEEEPAGVPVPVTVPAE